MKYEEKPTRKSFVDLEGKRFGMLTVLGYKGRDDKKQHLWHVQCDCGNDKVIIETGMRAGATNSCGCLRKNNGGRVALTQEQAEQLCPKVKFIEYKGMKHPATFKCIDCGKEGYAILANSLRDYKCECQITGAELKRTELFKAKGFTLLKSEGWYCRKHTIRCDYCETESVYHGTLEYIDECKCRLDVKSEEPSAIYCLYNNTDNYIKVGKSITPIRRQGEINSSRESIGLVPMEIYKIVWVVSEKASYYLESLYHNKHKEYRLYLDDWTGSTETFNLGVDSFDKFIEDHDKLISRLKTDEPPPPELQFTIPNTSFELNNMWFPSKIRARVYYRCSEAILNIMIDNNITLQAAVDQQTRLREENQKLHHAKYMYKGELRSIQEIADDLGINRNTIWYRVSKMGMSFEEAINAIYYQNQYETIGGELILKSEIESRFGIKYNTYMKRLGYGWDKNIAIHPLATRSGNWEYDNVVYSETNLFNLLGISLKSSYVYRKQYGVINTILKYIPDFDLNKLTKIN